MQITSIEEEEQIIQNLEELDSTLSLIKANLRKLKKKIDRIAQNNTKLSENLKPWINLFEIEKKVQISPNLDSEFKRVIYSNTIETPDIMGIKTMQNPFIDQNSSDLLNKSLAKNYGFTESSSMMMLSKSKLEGCETINNLDSEDNNSTLSVFTYTVLPDIFKQEYDLKKLYDFIAKRGTVSIDDVCKNFNDLQPEKLEIFINVLCRKNFIKQKKSFLTIENSL